METRELVHVRVRVQPLVLWPLAVFLWLCHRLWTAAPSHAPAAAVPGALRGILALHERGGHRIVALDIRDLDPALRPLCHETFVGDICDRALLGRLLAMYEIT